MKKFIVMTLVSLFSASAFAGATNAQFDCVSDSGRTVLTAGVPGDFAEHWMTLTIDGKAVEYFDTIDQKPPYESIKNSEIVVSGDMQKKNYGFVITELGNKSAVLFSFKAIAGSIKVKSVPNGERGTLRATIQGIDPRGDGKVVTKSIEVKCSYDYTI